MSWNSHRPRKKWGQNFLIQPHLCRRIVSLLNPSGRDSILEIGPGMGALTEILLECGCNYVGVERDMDLARYVRERLEISSVVVMDALSLAWEKIGSSPINKIIGNLPYNIASRLIWDLSCVSMGYEKMVFTVQKEVAERICASPGDRNYGPLGVWVQTFCTPRMEFLIPPGAFHPRPKVYSAVISLIPGGIGEALGEEEKKRLAGVLKFCFRAPRKQLGNILKRVWSSDIEGFFKTQGLDRRMRPCELTPAHYIGLSALL